MYEITPASILRTFAETGKVPADMLPLEEFDSTPEDPTRALRGAFEAILLARAAEPVLTLLFDDFERDKNKPWMEHFMVPLAEIEQEDFETRAELLRLKQGYVFREFKDRLGKVITGELDENNRMRLSEKVAYAYTQLGSISSPNEQAQRILEAADTLGDIINTLFHIAGDDYLSVLRQEPTAKQIVELVGNSYSSFGHLIASRHAEVPIEFTTWPGNLDTKYAIDTTTDVHKIIILNPAQYSALETSMRRSGRIKSQTIHCPFSMSSQFTKPFLDASVTSFKPNPLRHTFETLVRKGFGS